MDMEDTKGRGGREMLLVPSKGDGFEGKSRKMDVDIVRAHLVCKQFSRSR